MKGTLDCIPCLVRQAVEISGKVFEGDKERQEWIGRILSFLSEQDFLDKTPPDLAASFYRRLAEEGDKGDPYETVKKQYNGLILSMEDRLRTRILQASDPLREALVLAITGNIIDFGTPHGVSEESVLETIRISESSVLAMDDSTALFRSLKEGARLLYIGDNCGEIVFDKLFIEQLKQAYPGLSIVYAVRGFPVLNDITLDDAVQTGIDRLVPVIGNGDYAPGTRMSRVSGEFLDHFEKADIIISKGQGNLETLDEVSGKDIFFLFMAKCPVISRKTGVPLRSLMCLKGDK